MAKVKELLETLDDMRKVYQFDDKKADISISKMEETLDENDLEKLRDTLLRWSMVAVREELLQHGDLYNGFLASIESAIKEKWIYGTAHEMAEAVLNRIIGEE